MDAEPPHEMTTQMESPVVQAVKDIFEMMFGYELELSESRLNTTDFAFSTTNAVISLNGGAIGVICISLPEVTIQGILQTTLGDSSPDLEAANDLTREIANMIGGAAKSKVSHLKLKLGLPFTLRGADVQVSYPSGSCPRVLTFNSSIGTIDVVFGFVDKLLSLSSRKSQLQTAAASA